jgi:hypothetical protein
MLWFKDHDLVKPFAESFIAQKPEHHATLAIQTAFEFLENTCMEPRFGGRLSDRSCGSFCYSACKPPGHPSRSAKLVALPTAALRSTSGNMIDMSSSTSIEPRAQLFPMCWEMYEIAMNGPSLDLSPPKQTKWQGESRNLFSASPTIIVLSCPTPRLQSRSSQMRRSDRTARAASLLLESSVAV